MLSIMPLCSAPVFAENMTASAETSSSTIMQDSTKDKASIYIGLKDIETPMSGVDFEIYQLASYDSSDGTFHYVPEWNISSIPEQSDELDKYAEELSKNIKTPSVALCTTDESGHAFTDIDCGVYLLIPSKTEKYGDVSPFILRLPYLDEIGGSYNWVYDADVEPKVTIPGMETPTPTPTVTPVPDATVKGTSDVDTGDYTNISVFVLCILFVMVNLKFLFGKRKK